MKHLLARLKLRHKLTALSVVGVGMCVLPLLQVLRYQATEIDFIRGAESAIEPAVAAVDLQHGLLAHRDSAGRVLRGLAQAEAQRRQHQADVDRRLARLNVGLQAHGPASAWSEAQALGGDWTRLVDRVVGRALAADDSDAAHRLLIEQTLQVIDLVAALTAPGLDRDPALAHLRVALQHTLPQLTLRLAALPVRPAPATQAGSERVALLALLTATEAAVDKALRPLADGRPRAAAGAALADGRLAEPRLADPRLADARPADVRPGDARLGDSRPSDSRLGDSRPADAHLAAAAAQAREAARRHLRLLADPSADADTLSRAASRALGAQRQVVTTVHATLKGLLQQRIATIQTQRQRLLLTLGGLALLATILLLSLRRRGGPPPTPQANSPQDALPSASDGQSGLQHAVSLLLHRLRRPPPAAGQRADRAAAPRGPEELS